MAAAAKRSTCERGGESAGEGEGEGEGEEGEGEGEGEGEEGEAEAEGEGARLSTGALTRRHMAVTLGDKEAKNDIRDECGVVVMTREIVVLSCNG